MGKKKIKKQTEEELLKESATTNPSAVTVDKQIEKTIGDFKASHQLVRGRIFIQASYNNTIITVADEKGNVLAWASAGSLGFKGPKKATPYAASKIAEAIFEKTKKINFNEVEVFVKGIGSGRESAVRSLAVRGFNIVSIKDITPVPHNGPRPKKVRRV